MCQNVNNEALLTWFKFQVKIGVCVQRERQKYTHSSRSLSNDEGLKNIGHSMSVRNLIFGVNSVMVSDLILWQFITKCNTCYYKMWQLSYYKKQQKFITKCIEFLLQNGTVLLQNATVLLGNATILFWNATILLQNATVNTKCNIYFKLQQYKAFLIQISTSYHVWNWRYCKDCTPHCMEKLAQSKGYTLQLSAS